jgi:cytochrome P450
MNLITPRVADYDPFSKEVMANPLPFYEELRKHSPIHYLPQYDTFAISRFQDIVDILSIGDNAFVSGEDSTLPNPERLLRHNQGKPAILPLEPSIPIGTLLPSPHFEVLRHAHGKPFRPRAVLQLQELIRKLANERLDELLPKKTFDLTQDYGGIVAASGICHLLDIPLSNAREVLDLVNRLSQTDPEKGGNDIAQTIGNCVAKMLPAVAARRKAGADGSVPMVDDLINLDYYGRPLTDEEVAVQLVCVFVGGTETVPKIAAHGLMELNNRPEQMAAVRADLGTNVPIVVEEMIRYCAPAQWFCRTAHKDIDFKGQKIKAGQRIIVVYGSAARDPDEYDRPNDFIWDRKIDRVLSFGFGQHFCIGIHLARLELRTLVHEFLRRVPSFSFDMEKSIRLPSSFQWGWNSLTVVVD